MNFLRTLFLFLPLACSAQTIQGNVQNGTTGRPEPGHQVILFTSSGEQARTTTNQNGAFQITLRANLAPHSLAILKVIHDGVDYFQTVALGKVTNVRVYDSSSQVSGISGYLSILQFQVKGKLLQVTELHAFNNASSPPVTRSGSDNLVITIPEGAQVDLATVSAPDGGSSKLPLVWIPGRGGKYSIDFPMKPGLTKYAIRYKVPYAGELMFRRQAQYPMKRIGVILPESMRFRSLGAKSFRAVVDQPGTHEQVLDGLEANEAFAFELSGNGVLAKSFRPLTPGETSRSNGAKTVMNAPRRGGGSPRESASPGLSRSVYLVTLALGIIVLAGILLLARMFKKLPEREAKVAKPSSL